MRRIAVLLAVLLAVLATVTACGSGPEPAADAPASPSSDRSPSATPSRSPSAGSAQPPEQAGAKGSRLRGTRVVVARSPFGDMLFDARQQAIYLFDVETTSEPRCYGECARAWPPVRTTAEPAAGPGVRAGLLGTTRRRDGTTQVTYGGHPLYYYAHEAPGEVKCHDVFLNGGTWYAVGADGERLP